MNTATAAVETATERLAAMVGNCRDESQDDTSAAKLLLERAKSDDELYAAMLGPYEWLAAKDAIARTRKAQRGKIWHRQPSGDGGAANDRVAALVRVNSATLLDVPLLGGLPVRQVTRNVKRWRHAGMALRWTAAGLLEAQKTFRRLKAYRQLPILRNALQEHLRKAQADSAIETIMKAA